MQRLFGEAEDPERGVTLEAMVRRVSPGERRLAVIFYPCSSVFIRVHLCSSVVNSGSGKREQATAFVVALHFYEDFGNLIVAHVNVAACRVEAAVLQHDGVLAG